MNGSAVHRDVRAAHASADGTLLLATGDDHNHVEETVYSLLKKRMESSSCWWESVCTSSAHVIRASDTQCK